MDTLNRDLAALQLKNRNTRLTSVMDCVGADVDSSYDRPVTMQIASDTYHISGAGQVLGQNAGIQVQIDDEGIHYLRKYGIAGDVYLTAADRINASGSIENALVLFEGSELTLGGVTYMCSQNKYYQQFNLALLPREEVQKQSGLLLKTQDFASANLAEYTASLHAHYNMRIEEGDIATSQRVKFFVPLHYLFPQIADLPDQGAVPLMMGQKIKIALRTTTFNEAVLGEAAVPNWYIENLSLVRAFSKLDPVRMDLLLKSNIQLPKQGIIAWSQNSVTPVINSVYGISKHDRIRALVFGFPSAVDQTNAAAETNVVANLSNGTAAQFKYPLGFFPQVPIASVEIDVGGHQIVINGSQLLSMHTFQPSLYAHPMQAQMKRAYRVDLSRFLTENDLFGSSSKQITSVHVKITLKTGPGTNTLFGQTTGGWTAVRLSSLQFQSFLETQSMMEIRQGQISEVHQ